MRRRSRWRRDPSMATETSETSGGFSRLSVQSQLQPASFRRAWTRTYSLASRPTPNLFERPRDISTCSGGHEVWYLNFNAVQLSRVGRYPGVCPHCYLFGPVRCGRRPRLQTQTCSYKTYTTCLARQSVSIRSCCALQRGISRSREESRCCSHCLHGHVNDLR